MSSTTQRKTIKCVIVGDGAVGKTCTLISYTTDRFPIEYVPTIFDNWCSNVIVDNVCVNLSLWDTAGQETYDKLRVSCYSETDVFIVCFNTMSKSSYDNVRDIWMKEIQRECPGVPVVLVGTMVDLRHDAMGFQKTIDYVSYQEGLAMSKFIGAVTYLECSAKTREGLTEIFESAIRAVLSFQKKKKKKSICELV